MPMPTYIASSILKYLAPSAIIIILSASTKRHIRSSANTKITADINAQNTAKATNEIFVPAFIRSFLHAP